MKKEINFEILKKIMTDSHYSQAVFEILPDTNLIDSGIIDSYFLVQFVCELEASFNITFDYMDLTLENFVTLESIQSILISKYGFNKI